eukprot:s585_g19.t3
MLRGTGQPTCMRVRSSFLPYDLATTAISVLQETKTELLRRLSHTSIPEEVLGRSCGGARPGFSARRQGHGGQRPGLGRRKFVRSGAEAFSTKACCSALRPTWMWPECREDYNCHGEAAKDRKGSRAQSFGHFWTSPGSRCSQCRMAKVKGGEMKDTRSKKRRIADARVALARAEKSRQVPQLQAAIQEAKLAGMTDYNSCLFEAKRMLVGLLIKQRDIAIAEGLRAKRGELNRQIFKEKEEKAKIQEELSILTDKLQKINEGLAWKIQARSEYDKTIQETEAAYPESSQTLLRVVLLSERSLCRRCRHSARRVSRAANGSGWCEGLRTPLSRGCVHPGELPGLYDPALRVLDLAPLPRHGIPPLPMPAAMGRQKEDQNGVHPGGRRLQQAAGRVKMHQSTGDFRMQDMSDLFPRPQAPYHCRANECYWMRGEEDRVTPSLESYFHP